MKFKDSQLKQSGRLFCGDNLEGIKLLPSNSIDCCVTDPP
jgi:DNA modification methylase